MPTSPADRTSHIDSLQWTTLRLARKCHAEARAFAMNLAPSVDREAVLSAYAEVDTLFDNLHAALRRDDLRLIAAVSPSDPHGHQSLPATPASPCPAAAPLHPRRTEAAA